VTLADFLESVFGSVRRHAKEMRGEVPPPVATLGSRLEIADRIERSPLFVLEDGPGLVRFVDEFREDLVEDLAVGLMTPFPSVAVAFNWRDAWRLNWIIRLGSGEAGDRFLLVSFGENARDLPGFPQALEFEFAGKKDGQFLIHLAGETMARYLRVDRRPAGQVSPEIGGVVEAAILRVAAISHPANYILETTPLLTPREERRVERGERRPVRKKRHYVVIDHEGLADMTPRAPAEGSHSSPIPHARRGHWMRLSERCREARAQGRDRVWRREAFVGPREFADESNRYRILLSTAELPAIQ